MNPSADVQLFPLFSTFFTFLNYFTKFVYQLSINQSFINVLDALAATTLPKFIFRSLKLLALSRFFSTLIRMHFLVYHCDTSFTRT